MSKNILFVRNIAQKVLFETELQGQLSDGHWENSTPQDHWKPWCNAKVRIEEGKLGRTFLVAKDNYNFANKDLLDVVEKRMISYVRLGLTFGADTVELLEYYLDFDGNFRGAPTFEGSFYDDVRWQLSASNVSADQVQQAVNNESLYTKKDLIKDLKDLKVIVRQYIRFGY